MFKSGKIEGVSGNSGVKDALGKFWVLGVWGEGVGVFNFGYVVYGRR